MTTTTPATTAAAYLDDADRPAGQGRRWPFQPLLDATRLTATELAVELAINGSEITRAALHGLSDLQADRWAIRLGFHPVLVWGWDWIDDALASASPRTLLADDLRRQIEAGELRPGDPLPPVKELAHQWCVSDRVVTGATDELRREGLVTDPGRGKRPVVLDPVDAEPRPCSECDHPIEPGIEHYPHRPGCVRAAVGWCDCDHPTHPECCPTCQRDRP